jgi:hypothetical protein
MERDIMKKISRINGACALLVASAVFFTYLTFGIVIAKAKPAAASDERALIQIDPEPEQLDQVSEPVGEISEPVGGVSETDDQASEEIGDDSETDDQASEEVGSDIAPTESLDRDSETDDQASEEVGADSETAGQASEILPSAPGGEEYPLEEQAPVQEEMPLGDREAEGRGLGE